jgi:uncharacterized protein involved in exopolysaccharide biosynthesis
MTITNYHDAMTYRAADERAARQHEPAFLDVRNLADTLLGSARLIGWTMAVMAVLALVVAMLLPPSFISTTRILIDPRGLRLVENELTPPSQTTDANTAIVESQMRVLISDSVLMKVVEQENLASDPEFGAKEGVLSGLRDLLGADSTGESENLVALRALWDAVDVQRTPDSYIIDLSVDTRDPRKSARLATAIADIYVENEIAQRAEIARQASSALFSRLDELRLNLANAEERVERYRAENRIVDTDGALITEQQVAQISEELTRARVEASRAEEKYQQIRRSIESGGGIAMLPEVLQSTTVSRLREAHVVALREERALSRDLMAQHPALVRAREQVATLEGEIAAELRRIAVSSEKELDRARQNLAHIETMLEASKSSTLDTKQALVQFRELQRDAQASRMVYEAYLVRAREIDEQQGLNTTSARVISPALPAAEPRGLSLPAVLVLALAAGLGLGCVLALARAALAQPEPDYVEPARPARRSLLG